MALKLTVRPAEKIVVKGATFENVGTRSVSLLLCKDVPVLLQRDIIDSADATTLWSRLYVLIALLYVNEAIRRDVQPPFLTELDAMSMRDPTCAQDLDDVRRGVASGDYYRCLMTCRRLMRAQEYVPVR